MRLLRNNIRSYSHLLIIALIGPLLAGCSIFGPSGDSRVADSAGGTNSLRVDPLRVGDSIKVDFSGTPSSITSVGPTDIKGDGTVRFEYIGDVQAAGLTPGELEKAIQAKYVPEYYTHLNVTVTPTARYFYVEGEVNGGGGGRIMYSGPITVTGAIAAAGGFTPFGDRKRVKLIRVNASKAITVNCNKAIEDSKLDLPVYPGDKIVVNRRLW
jgi:protein involved in polysaccharide export with SLBB domain